ncbi:MAG: hypothetical protein ACP5UD_05735 [Conexivisphaera sp.]|jgi:hypothetical protein
MPRCEPSAASILVANIVLIRAAYVAMMAAATSMAASALMPIEVP